MYILLVYERELSKNDYLRPLLITIIKSIKKLIKKNKNFLKIIQTDKKKSYYLNLGLRTLRWQCQCQIY